MRNSSVTPKAPKRMREQACLSKDRRYDAQHDCPSACLPRARSPGARGCLINRASTTRKALSHWRKSF